ncbi:MAG: hypothetical protein ACI9W4_000026 [Rhodothermales bacterium]|jgi:hypothetical protein
MKPILFCAILLVSVTNPARAQISAAAPLLIDYPIPDITEGSVDFGDMDGDGDLDLVLTGLLSNGSALSRVLVLEDSMFVASFGGFQVVLSFKVYRTVPAILNQVWNGSASWGDADGDGDGDLLLFGKTIVERVIGEPRVETVGELFINDGLNLVQAQSFQGLFAGDVAWGDYDADGDQDFAACGAANPEPPYDQKTIIYRNTGGRFEPISSGLPGTMLCTLDWGDMDADGDLDLALTGESALGSLSVVYKQIEPEVFQQVDLGMPGLYLADLDWGDYDNDGRSDLVISGGVLDPQLLRGLTVLFKSTPAGMVRVETDLPNLLGGGVAWSDYDVDGNLDIILTGAESVLGRRAGRVMINEAGQFRREFVLAGLTQGDLTVGDYNGDGDDDFLIIGFNDEGRPFANFLMNQTFPEFVPAGAVRR